MATDTVTAKTNAKRKREEEEEEGAPSVDAKKTTSFVIFVKPLTGKTISIDVPDKSFKISELKRSIHASEGIPPDKQRLIYAGRQLEDAKDMTDYNVQMDATIHLVLRERRDVFQWALIGADDLETKVEEMKGGALARDKEFISGTNVIVGFKNMDGGEICLLPESQSPSTTLGELLNLKHEGSDSLRSFLVGDKRNCQPWVERLDMRVRELRSPATSALVIVNYVLIEEDN